MKDELKQAVKIFAVSATAAFLAGYCLVQGAALAIKSFL